MTAKIAPQFLCPTARPRSVLSDRQAFFEHQPGAGAEFFALALELAAGGENVAAAGRAHRACVTRVEHDFRETLNRLPIGAFEGAARPRVEGDEVDLGGQ